MKKKAEMKVKPLSRYWLLALLPLLTLAMGCPKVDPVDPAAEEEARKIAADPQYTAKQYLRSEYMDIYYYWRDQVNARNAGYKAYDFADIYDFFDALLYKDDRWSWMCDKQEYISDETGVISGTWGISLSQSVKYFRDYSLRVRYIYPGSPLEPFGITRGAMLTHINGKNVWDDKAEGGSGFTGDKLDFFQEQYYSAQTLKFTFRLVNGVDTTFTATRASSLSTNPGLITRVFQPGEFPGLTEPVGYFHYLAFKANFLDDIHDAMATFHAAGVKKLIIDLRYNGGGDSRASQLLVDYLAPKSAEGKPFVVRKHNSLVGGDMDMTGYVIGSDKSKYADGSKDAEAYWDKVYPNRINPEQLYFIVGPGSASASEMVMNGLRPYMGDKQQMVGDTTYGKPNGMYVLMYPGSDDDYAKYNSGDYSKLQWVFLPICFFNVNSNGQSIPWDGFVPDRHTPDDLYHDFGVEEDNIKACLTHLVTGSYPAASTKSIETKAPEKTGYRIEVEEDSPKWGRDWVQKPNFSRKN